MKVGDRIVVTSPLSVFYGRPGTLLKVNPRNEGGQFTPFQYLVRIDDYDSPSVFGVPFMENEVRPLPPADPAGPFAHIVRSTGEIE